MNNSEITNFLKNASEDSCIKLKMNDFSDIFIIFKKGSDINSRFMYASFCSAYASDIFINKNFCEELGIEINDDEGFIHSGDDDEGLFDDFFNRVKNYYESFEF